MPRAPRPPLRREPNDSALCDGAKALRAWRKDHGVAQTKLEKYMRVSFRAIHEWEFGASVPSFVNAAKLEEVTDGVIRVEAWGYSAEDCALLVAFGLRRARQGVTPTPLAPKPLHRPLILRKDPDPPTLPTPTPQS